MPFNRRRFLKKSALSGLTLGSMIAAATSSVNRASTPSNLIITDLRYLTVEHLGRPCSILRIDTNQDIYGYGEVRDGGEVKTTLMLKGLLLRKNPCQVEGLN